MLRCIKCQRDLLHHNLYHLVFHFCCKFCLQTAYKLRANTIDELRKEIKLEERYLETVYELCDAKFCEPHFRKEHMKYAHAEDRFEFQFCDSSYASKVSLKYHEQTKHVKAAPVECQLCLEIFATDVTLKNHIKVVHGTNSAYSCDYCDAKFNQKKKYI